MRWKVRKRENAWTDQKIFDDSGTYKSYKDWVNSSSYYAALKKPKLIDEVVKRNNWTKKINWKYYTDEECLIKIIEIIKEKKYSLFTKWHQTPSYKIAYKRGLVDEIAKLMKWKRNYWGNN